MLHFAFRRLLSAIPTLFIIFTLAFVLVRAAPGGPFDTERGLPAAVEANLNAKYHLDEPLIQQYGRYLWDMVRLKFGPSFQYMDFTVDELIHDGFKVSLRLGGTAILIALVVGVTLGTVAALRQNHLIDYSVMTVAMTGISIPNFVVAPLCILVFGVIFKLLPAGGWDPDKIQTMILPTLALALPQIAYVARITRGSMVEVLRSNFIRTARAKGLPGWLVVVRHGLKPTLLPVISYLGPATAAVITGSVVIEQIFGIPGLGRFFVQGALNRDYTLVMGIVVFYGVLIILFNFVVDILYGFLDPKVRYS